MSHLPQTVQHISTNVSFKKLTKIIATLSYPFLCIFSSKYMLNENQPIKIFLCFLILRTMSHIFLKNYPFSFLLSVSFMFKLHTGDYTFVPHISVIEIW